MKNQQHNVWTCQEPGCKRQLGFHGYASWKLRALEKRMRRRAWKYRVGVGCMCGVHYQLDDVEIKPGMFGIGG
jgi:hypothetical protein